MDNLETKEGYNDLEDSLAAEFDLLADGGNDDELEASSSEEEPGEEIVEVEASEEAKETEIEEEGDAIEASEEEPADSDDAPDYNEPAPDRWPSDIKQAYNEMPPEHKKLFMERIYKPMQSNYTKSTMELSEMRKSVEPMVQILDQHKHLFEQSGESPAQALERQLAWAAHLQRVGPEQGLKDMANSFGLNGNNGQAEEEYLTPAERAMKAELAELKNFQQQSLNAQRAEQQERQAGVQQQREQEVSMGLQTFINEKDGDLPAHPHVEKVAPSMAGLIRGGLVTRTDEYGQPVPIRDVIARAYKMACDLDSSIKPAAPSKRQVNRAKAANRGVVAKQPSNDQPVQAGSILGTIDDVYNQLNGRNR